MSMPIMEDPAAVLWNSTRGGEVLEFNINGRPVEGLLHVDFDASKGCFVLTYVDGHVQEVYLSE